MLTTPDLFATIVPNQGGGTRKEAAYDCPACARQNDVPAALLPKGLVPLLPLREAWLAARAVEVVAVPEPVAAPLVAAEPALAAKVEPVAVAAVPALEVPVWATGKSGRSLLDEGLSAVRAGTASMVGLRRRDGQFVAEAIAVEAVEDLLDSLDEMDCELLIIDGGLGAGKTIFHPRAGATSFVR
ncbi:hypothetical protein GCM10011529_10310 [Polymorphobacter glacialis]|uniref:Uncharacterized protein n=1 Tax=Sandarakinorhabdus glacialis TaxID=1614636 RepID=A0A916ZQ16_9SPHN|nr:hypothetical protein [Polymorphobacter glacialis]GGE05858.1 hypothetical protein GCM10011529_10310 [Polymorphobacter glacialis]